MTVNGTLAKQVDAHYGQTWFGGVLRGNPCDGCGVEPAKGWCHSHYTPTTGTLCLVCRVTTHKCCVRN